MAVMLAIIAVTNTPVLGKHFVFYVSKLRSPLLWSLTTVFVIITYKLLLQVGVLQDSKFLTQANNYLDPLITCAVVTAITFLVKGLAVRYMAIGFQRAAFYRRIKKSLLEEYVLNCLLNRKPKKHAVESLAKTLKNYLKLKSGGDRLSIITKQQNPTMKVVKDKRKQHPSYDEQEDGKQGIAGWFDFDLNDDSVFDAIQVQESELLDREPISNHKLAVFVEFIKSTELLYTKGLYKRCIMRMHEKEQFKEDLPTITYEHGEEHLDMSNAKASRLLAHAIWLRLNPKGDTVSAENFVQFMNPEMAAVGFSLFVGNWNGVIKETDIFTTLLSIARERRALKTALYDGESSVDRLDSAISGTCAMILFVFYFIIFGYNAQQVLTTLSSFLLAVAFAVGSSAKALLESIIFIFGRHPFDIGDRVVIDKVVYTVAKVGLLTSELRRYDNSIVYFSNSELSSKPILNLRRSPDQVDLIKMQVSFYTKKRQLKMFESKLASFMSKHTYHYHPKFEVEYQDLENSNRMNIRIWVTHRSNFQNMKRYRERRGRLILFIKKACENLGIEYELPAQRVISDTYGWDVTGSYQPGENTVFDLPQTSDVQSQPRGDPSPNLSATKTVIHAPSGGLFLSKSGGYGLNPPAAEHDYEYDTLNAARSPIAQKTMADIDGMRYNDGLFRENTPYDPVASFID
jgi:small-conductance mechanosensitive channel